MICRKLCCNCDLVRKPPKLTIVVTMTLTLRCRCASWIVAFSELFEFDKLVASNDLNQSFPSDLKSISLLCLHSWQCQSNPIETNVI